jgi:hypothetical protein
MPLESLCNIYLSENGYFFSVLDKRALPRIASIPALEVLPGRWEGGGILDDDGEPARTRVLIF